jgi:hypothetical protein
LSAVENQPFRELAEASSVNRMTTYQAIYEPVRNAIRTLSEGAGDFESRILDAYSSSLYQLFRNDDAIAACNKLSGINKLCESHLDDNKKEMRKFSPSEREQITSGLVDVLIESHRQILAGEAKAK